MSLANGASVNAPAAARQLTICNSCRYCEGLCAVFPALERRTVFADGVPPFSNIARMRSMRPRGESFSSRNST